MQCRHCKHQYLLSDTIFWSFPPGIPFSPRVSFVGVAVTLFMTLLLKHLFEKKQFVITVAGFLIAAFFIGHYLLHWVFDRDPYTKLLPGTCPKCHKYNFPMPWTGR